MTSRRKMSFQLYEQGGAGAMRGESINATGGHVLVVTRNGTTKQAITDKDGTALSNPVALTNGAAEFHVLATVSFVDLYIMAPGGQFLVVEDVDESLADIAVDVTNTRQMAIIPFNIADTTAATETDTGFDLPEDSMVLDRLHGSGLKITAIDATETIDVGTLVGEGGGDPNGFNAAAVLDNLGYLAGTNGALHSSNAPYMTEGAVARSITYTLTAGSDTAAGFILLVYVLCKAGA